MTKVEFNKLTMKEKADLVWAVGDYVNMIHYYGHKVLPFTVESHYVEIYYSPQTNDVTEISILETPERLSHYAMNIDITDAL